MPVTPALSLFLLFLGGQDVQPVRSSCMSPTPVLQSAEAPPLAFERSSRRQAHLVPLLKLGNVLTVAASSNVFRLQLRLPLLAIELSVELRLLAHPLLAFSWDGCGSLGVRTAIALPSAPAFTMAPGAPQRWSLHLGTVNPPIPMHVGRFPDRPGIPTRMHLAPVATRPAWVSPPTPSGQPGGGALPARPWASSPSGGTPSVGMPAPSRPSFPVFRQPAVGWRRR